MGSVTVTRPDGSAAVLESLSDYLSAPLGTYPTGSTVRSETGTLLATVMPPQWLPRARDTATTGGALNIQWLAQCALCCTARPIGGQI